jgi:hypothetical protein
MGVVEHDSPMANISGSFILHMQIPGLFWNFRSNLVAIQQPRSSVRTGSARNFPKIAECAGVVDELWSRYVMAAKTS